MSFSAFGKESDLCSGSRDGEDSSVNNMQCATNGGSVSGVFENGSTKTWADMVKKSGNCSVGETRVCAPPSRLSNADYIENENKVAGGEKAVGSDFIGRRYGARNAVANSEKKGAKNNYRNSGNTPPNSRGNKSTLGGRGLYNRSQQYQSAENGNSAGYRNSGINNNGYPQQRKMLSPSNAQHTSTMIGHARGPPASFVSSQQQLPMGMATSIGMAQPPPPVFSFNLPMAPPGTYVPIDANSVFSVGHARAPPASFVPFVSLQQPVHMGMGTSIGMAQPPPPVFSFSLPMAPPGTYVPIDANSVFTQEEKFRNTWLEQECVPSIQISNERDLYNYFMTHNRTVVAAKDSNGKDAQQHGVSNLLLNAVSYSQMNRVDARGSLLNNKGF